MTGVLSLGGLAACSRAGSVVAPTADAVTAAGAARRVAGRHVVTARLNPRRATINLGARTVQTWAYHRPPHAVRDR